MKSCPFCGAEGHHRRGLLGDQIACNSCGASTDGYASDVEALTAWNRRPRETLMMQLLAETALHIRKVITTIEEPKGEKP